MIIQTNKELKPNTGILVPHSRNGNDTSIVRIINPILSKVSRRVDIKGRSLEKPSFDINTIHTGYLTDGYLRQGVDKYVELLLKEGWKLVGRDDPVEYLKHRFKLMGIMTDPPTPWEILVSDIVRDFVKYGNVILAIQRSPYLEKVTKGKIRGLNNQPPVGAYFTLPVLSMSPETDKTGKVTGWKHKYAFGDDKTFPASDILHFTYYKEPGEIWGIPFILPVIEDVRALRQIEESVLKLIYKHLNPLIHQEVPDITGTGEGRQEDIDAAAATIGSMAVDGYIITPPGHKINVIGAESQAIRAEGYIKLFKQRVFSGLGMSALAMGESEGTARNTAETLTLQLHNKAKIFHYLISQYITNFIINELLLEGGFNPILNEDDAVIFTWNEIETDRRIKEQTHYLNMWSMNALGYKEFRKLANLPAIEPNWEDFYVHQVQIPQVVAAKVGVDPLMLSQDDFKRVFDAGVATKDKPKSTSIAKQGGDASPPSNQHTPKASYDDYIDRYSELCDNILDLIDPIRSNTKGKQDIQLELLKCVSESMALPISEQIYTTVLNSASTESAMLSVTALLTNERYMLLSHMSEDNNV